MSYAITVEFVLMPGAMVAFRPLIDENAQNSIDLEPGCLRFDVLAPHDGPDTVFLYEIYDSRQAFEAHLKSAHFLSFNAQSERLIKNRTIKNYDVAYEALRKQG